MLVTSVSPAAHMHRRAARGDVAAALLCAGSIAAALLRAGSIAVALLRAGSIAVALLHTGSIAVALLRAARALSVQNRYANERDVQKRYGSEQGGERGGAVFAAYRRRAAWRGEENGAAGGAASRTAQRGERLSETRRIGSEKRPRAGTRGRLGSACGDTTLRVETRVRGHAASWTTCWNTTARRF